MAPAPTHACVQCGQTIPRDSANEICPACCVALLSPIANTDLTESGDSQFTNPKSPLIEQLVAVLPDREPIRPLGAGGMGQVYLLRHRILERLEALKILQAKIASSPRFRRRFLRESKVLAQLRHPNIVSIFDCTEVNGFLCVLMEYVDGGTLRLLLKSEDVGLDRRIAILTQIAEAMSYAHEQGVIHRDLKPENILLTSKGEVKVADFGIGKILDDENSAMELSTQGAMGTPGYMAPEQRDTPGLVDRRCDVFSMGILAYEVLTRKMPQGAFERPSTLVDVSERVDEVIERALSNDVEGRYSDGEAFLSAWREATATSSGWILYSRPITSAWRRLERTRFLLPRRILVGLFVLMGILFLGQQIYQLNHSKNSNQRSDSPVGNKLFEHAKPLREGQFFELPGLDIKMNWVQGGSFNLGHNNGVEWESHPSVPVTISYGFWMAQFELTQLQFQNVMDDNPSKFDRDYFAAKSEAQDDANWQNRPVESLSWQMAHEFCETLTLQAQKHGVIPSDYCFRLPSELEWEYVCRSGGKPVFLPGLDLASVKAQAWTVEDSSGVSVTQVVGSKQPNDWGFYDMLGNVSEFCLDRYWDYKDFAGSSLTNWISSDDCRSDRMIRGGHYLDAAAVVTSTLRGATCIYDTDEPAGIRLVLSRNTPLVASVRSAVEPDPFVIKELRATFNWVTPGVFNMGESIMDSPRGFSVYPPTETRISSGFWIGDSEVTEFQYQSVIDGKTDLRRTLDATADPLDDKALPISDVSWAEALDYCDRLTKILRSVGRLPDGYVARLPTEAEWEWACRRCFKAIYHWGPEPGPIFGTRARYSLNSSGVAGPVKEKWAGPGCISGMYGNVKEWCLDWKFNYSGQWIVNPIGSVCPEGNLKCARGGDFLSPPELCSATARTFLPFDSKSPQIGFPVVIGTAAILNQLGKPPNEP